jgi:hypothetical protein
MARMLQFVDELKRFDEQIVASKGTRHVIKIKVEQKSPSIRSATRTRKIKRPKRKSPK